MLVKFPYHDSFIEADLPDDRLVGVLKARITEYDAGVGEAELVHAALRSPVGTEELRKLAAGKQNVLLITSDHTRNQPSGITLPILLSEIKAGNPAADITILIATGLHRAMTEAEMRARFGDEIVDNYNIINHNAFDADSCVPVCTLPSGASFELNRLALECDLLVTEGFIEPHFFAGYSGGRKSIIPGICSYTTVVENHSAAAIDHPRSKSGVLEGNVIHEDMLYALSQVRVDFTLSVALGGEGQIIGAFAGDIVQSHAVGCEFVEQLSRAQALKGDIVITSNGGLPLDQNLYQCPKCAATAMECISEGGVLILVAACSDGLGGDHFEKLMKSGTPAEIYERIMAIPPKDTIPEQWCAQAFSQILLQHKIVLVSGLAPEVVRGVNMLPASTIEQALEIATEHTGQGSSIVAIPDGVSVVIK